MTAETRPEPLERLQQLWALNPNDVGLLRALIAALVREDRTEEALALAREAIARQHLSGQEIAQGVGSYLQEPWQGRNGGRFEGRLRGPLTQPQIAWRWTSHDPHDTFGKPLCAGYGRAAALLQNSVVGMRFERLVMLDLTSGTLLWEQERKGLLFSGALAWFSDGPSIGWPYIVAEDNPPTSNPNEEPEDKRTLCLERFNLTTGQTLSLTRLDLPPEHGLEPAPELTPLSNRYGWLLKWRDERSSLTLFHKGSGAFLGFEPLAVAAQEVTQIEGTLFAVDDEGVVQLEGARVEDVVFRTPARRGHKPSRAGSATDPKPWALIAQGGFHFLMAQPQPLRASWIVLSERYILSAVSPTAEALCREIGSDTLSVMRAETQGPLELYRVEVARKQSHRVASIRATWMGGDWLIMMAYGGMFEAATLLCVDGQSHTIKWRCEVPSVWHQGPIPIQGGILGVSGEGVVFLTDM